MELWGRNVVASKSCESLENGVSRKEHSPMIIAQWNLLFFSCPVRSDSLQPQGLQHARLLCPTVSPGVCSNSCPLSWWCFLSISSSAALFSSCPQSFRVFSKESALRVRWPKYWSFSISPSNEYSGLISFRIDWFDLLAVQGILKSLLWPYHSKASHKVSKAIPLKWNGMFSERKKKIFQGC